MGPNSRIKKTEYSFQARSGPEFLLSCFRVFARRDLECSEHRVVLIIPLVSKRHNEINKRFIVAGAHH